MRALLALLALVSLTLGGSAAAGCVVTTSDAVAAGPYYLAGNAGSLFCNPTCFIDIWVYDESNGIEGLQRGDDVVDDTCGGQIASDTIVF